MQTLEWPGLRGTCLCYFGQRAPGESSLPAAGLCGAGPQGGGQRRLHPGKAQVERGVAIQAEGGASAESEGLEDQSSLK